jgi:hypothetical protein
LVPTEERHEPGVHGEQAAAPAPLKWPTGHARPVLSTAWPAPTVCAMLTTYVPTPPEPVPKLTTVVPSAMAALASTVPTVRVPEETAETVRSVPATEATPTKVPVPVGQKAPAAHVAPTGDDAPAAHVVPAAHGLSVAVALPVAVQKPAAQADAHGVERRGSGEALEAGAIVSVDHQASTDGGRN